MCPGVSELFLANVSFYLSPCSWQRITLPVFNSCVHVEAKRQPNSSRVKNRRHVRTAGGWVGGWVGVSGRGALLCDHVARRPNQRWLNATRNKNKSPCARFLAHTHPRTWTNQLANPVVDTQKKDEPLRALGASAYLHHVDNSVRVLHVVLGLADFHANGAREALATLQNVEPEKNKPRSVFKTRRQTLG